MVSPNGAESIAEGVVSILPPEVANQIVFLVQAIGGLFILYLIFLGIRLYFDYRNMRNLRRIRNDLEMIKKKLK